MKPNKDMREGCRPFSRNPVQAPVPGLSNNVPIFEFKLQNRAVREMGSFNIIQYRRMLFPLNRSFDSRGHHIEHYAGARNEM